MFPVKTACTLLLTLGLAGCVDGGNTDGYTNKATTTALRPKAAMANTTTIAPVNTANTANTATTASVVAAQAQVHLPTRGFVGEYLPLDGSSSTGDTLAYQWSALSAPANGTPLPSTSPETVPSTAPELTDSTFARAVLVAKQAGTYPIQLEVTDRLGRISTVSARTHVLGQPNNLHFQVLDAEYSSALDSLILVSRHPDFALYILKPASGELKKIPLPAAPTSVAVSPDGHTAVVGHEASLSQIDLVKGNSARPMINVNFEVFDIALNSNGVAYASLPEYVQWDTLYEINLKSGIAQPAITNSLMFSGGSHLQYQVQDQAIYTIDANLLPIDLNRFDAKTSPAHWQRESPYAGEYDMGGRPSPSNLWLSEDGPTLLTSGGSLFQTSSKPALDMKYLRSLPDLPKQAGLTGLVHANHSIEAARFAVISLETTKGTADRSSAYFLKTYTTPDLQLEDAIPLNGLDFSRTSEPVIPQFVFFNSAGTARYALLNQGADSYLMAF